MNSGDLTHSIHWVAPTHTHTERSVDWYWALGAAAVIGIGLSVWFGNILLAIIIALAALSLGLLAARYPREHEVSLIPSGIVIDREFYPFERIHSFWIHEEHPVHPKLYLATRAILHPHIAVIIEEPAGPEDVRDYMLNFVPEGDGHTFATFVAEVLGF